MGASGNFKHIASTQGATAVSAAYANSVTVELSQRTLIQSSLYIVLDTIAGGATKTTVRVTSDAGGNISLVPDTEAVISAGITVASVGTTVYKTDIIVPATATEVYAWVKLDAGTANVISVVITGIE
jgi:hypothetical protein